VTRAVASLFVTVRFATFTDPSATVPLTVKALKMMPWPVFVSVLTLFTVRLVAMRSYPSETVPATVKDSNCWPAPSVIVRPDPVKVIDEPVDVNAVAEEVFHEPANEIDEAAKLRLAGPTEDRSPLKVRVAPVNVRLADHETFEMKVVVMPKLTVRLETVCGTLTVPPEAAMTTVDVPTANAPRCVSMDVTVMSDPFAAKLPPAFTVSVAAEMGRFDPLVLSVVVPPPPEIVSVPPIVSAFEAMANVTVDAPELNVTFPANSGVRLPNVIVWEADELKVTDAAKLQDADVDAFVQDPLTIQDPPAFVT